MGAIRTHHSDKGAVMDSKSSQGRLSRCRSRHEISPATKAMPKEMLPIVDRPLIQYAADEARAAGVEEMIFVTSRGKTMIADHFDVAYELEANLRERGKMEALANIRDAMPKPGQFSFTRQQEPLGLGHAVWCARNFISNEPFAVLLADDLILADPGCMAQMVETYERIGGNVVAVEDVPREDTAKYGILRRGVRRRRIGRGQGLGGKTEPGGRPSTLSIIGRYILQSGVFEHLARQEKGAGNEIQLTDAMAGTIGETPFHGLRFEGRRYDCGTKQGFVEANVAFALNRNDIGADVRALLKKHL